MTHQRPTDWPEARIETDPDLIADGILGWVDTQEYPEFPGIGRTFPILAAHRAGLQLWVWCPHERRWHYHGGVEVGSGSFGAGDGHRSGHCTCRMSPMKDGYVLEEVGDLTPAVKKAHGHITRAARCPSCRRSEPSVYLGGSR